MKKPVGRAGQCSRRWCTGVLFQQTPEPPRRKGAGEKENTTKKSAGKDSGRPQELCNAWRRCTRARPVAPGPRRRTNNVLRNHGTVPRASKSVVVTGGTAVGGGSREREVPTGPARSRSDRMGTVGTGETTGAGAIATAGAGRGRGIRGGVVARLADGLGAPLDPTIHSTAGGAVPVTAAVRRRARVEMRPEGGMTVRHAELPGGEGVDAAGSVIAAESALCEVCPSGEEHAGRQLSRQRELLQSPFRPLRVRQKKTKRKRCWR